MLFSNIMVIVIVLLKIDTDISIKLITAYKNWVDHSFQLNVLIFLF